MKARIALALLPSLLFAACSSAPQLNELSCASAQTGKLMKMADGSVKIATPPPTQKCRAVEFADSGRYSVFKHSEATLAPW